MPELPEVEVVCRGLALMLLGRKIEAVIFGKQKLRLPLPVRKMSTWVTGRTVIAVRRRAKYIIIELDSAALLVIHLGMTGRLGLFSSLTPKAKHDHACWRLDNGLEMRFNDTRRFGSIQVFGSEKTAAEFFGTLGPDPFWESFTATYLAELAKARNQPVKNFLMDNRIVTGIGNIYASEILFASRINPTTPARALTAEEWQKIVVNSRTILAAAIDCGGSTIADYVNSSGEKGYFQTRLKVYGRDNEPCPDCRAAISHVRLGGRASFYCPGCQPAIPRQKAKKKP
jgi:formamidopyrimidine-DNA glycosylase